MSTSHVRDELTVVPQVRWSETVQQLINKHRQFEVNSLFHRRPMEMCQHRSDMIMSGSTSDEPCRRVHRCRTATCYSSPVDMAWHHMTCLSVCVCGWLESWNWWHYYTLLLKVYMYLCGCLSLWVFRSPQDSCLYLVYDPDPQALFRSFDELQHTCVCVQITSRLVPLSGLIMILMLYSGLLMSCHIRVCVFRSPQDSCLYLVYDHDPQALFRSFDELQLFEPDQATDIISVHNSVQLHSLQNKMIPYKICDM